MLREDSETWMYFKVGGKTEYESGKVVVFDSIFPAITFPVRKAYYDILSFQWCAQ